MYRAPTLVLAVALCSPAFAENPQPLKNPDDFCERSKSLSSITKQLPDYVLSWKADTPVVVYPPLKFSAINLLLAARGQPVCIAVGVGEAGEALDAAAYFPKRLALSKTERQELLAIKFQPATQDGKPIKSIMVMKAELK